MNGKALVVFPTASLGSMSDFRSALLSKTSEEVTKVLRSQLETFQLMTEISNSTASLELTVKGNLTQLYCAFPGSEGTPLRSCIFP